MFISKRNYLWLGPSLLFAIVASAQTSKVPKGYTGLTWSLYPKTVMKDGKKTAPVAKDGKSLASTLVEFRFDKAVSTSQAGGCFTTERSYWGNILKCSITLPNAVAGGIVQLTYWCEPTDSEPCKHTVECPSGATCIEANTNYLYPTTPHNLEINKPRSLVWHGWTNDANHAVLVFEANVQ